MSRDLDLTPRQQRSEPLILTVPGLHGSGPDHWQTRWEQRRDDCRRVDLGLWDAPHRNTWVNKLNLAIHQAQRPVVLVAHSLGCLTVAWWAEFEQPAFANPVVGALLVAPPDLDRAELDPRLARFAPCPAGPLPFPSFVVASHDDRWCGYRAARMLARTWGARFADAGAAGHINAESALGAWSFGEALLERLLLEHARATPFRREIAAPLLRPAMARRARVGHLRTTGAALGRRA